MAVVDINHVNLRAAPTLLDRLRDWYRDVVGLEVGPRPPLNNAGYWLYAGERPVVHLSAADPDESRTPGRDRTFDHVAFTCEDFATMRARLDALRLDYRMADVPASRQRQIFLADPAGNGVELNFTL